MNLLATRCRSILIPLLVVAAGIFLSQRSLAADAPSTAERHLLYVAVPGIRDDLKYGGHGVLVFDIDHGHQFVRRIAAAGLDAKGKPMNVKGVCANAATGRLYVSTLKTLTCFDLRTDKILWEKTYENGCDRMSMSPDGKTMFLPTLEGTYWHVVDSLSGDEIAKIVTGSGSHNTVVGPDGKEAYLAGLKSPVLTIADVEKHTFLRTVGPFTAQIRPFTVDGQQAHCFVNVNGLLGFEVGDLHTGKKLFRVEVQNFSTGKTARHGCPSHGIGLTPDGKELWVCDAFNRRMHVFDATLMPPKQMDSIECREEPGWITFGIDGRYAYPSTGDVVDAKTHKVLMGLKDEEGREVASEKLLEIDFVGDAPVRAGNQFGISTK